MIYRLFDIVGRSFLLICLYFASLGPFALGTLLGWLVYRKRNMTAA